jgi:hypothetical protein
MPVVRAKSSNPPGKTDPIVAGTVAEATREKLIDEAVEETFPASDPPSYMGGATTGAPRRDKPKPKEAKKARR